MSFPVEAPSSKNEENVKYKVRLFVLTDELVCLSYTTEKKATSFS